MKNQQPSQYTNFITINDVLHPESLYATEQEQPPPSGTADAPVVVIDEPYRPAAGSNKWNVLWAEATLRNDGSKEKGEVKNDISTPHLSSAAYGATPSPNGATTAASPPTAILLDAPYHHSGLMESAFGLPLLIGAVAGTVVMEAGTVLVYLTAVGMHALAVQCKGTNCGIFTWIPLLLYFIFEVHVAVLMLFDYILFIGSIVLSESLAVSCRIVNSIFSCGRCGMQWHQYIRRVCHVTRWSFRDFHQHWEPPRAFPCGHPSENDAPPPQFTATPTTSVDPERKVDPVDVSKPKQSNNIDVKV
jgi:hypothetical protein